MINYYKELMDLALQSIKKIENDTEKVDAISKILPCTFIVEDEETSTPEPISSVKEEVKPKRGRKSSKKEEKVEEQVVAETTTSEEMPSEPIVDEKLAIDEEIKAEEKKPLAMVKPDPVKVEEIKEEIQKTYELTLPSAEDTEEEIEARRIAVVKQYGDMTLHEAFSDENIAKYLEREHNSISVLKQTIMDCFGIVIDDNGNETSESGISSDQIEQLIYFYIQELDPSAEDYTQVKVDKFVTKFVPYMKTLNEIYKFNRDEISEGGRAMFDVEDFTPDTINIDNAGPLLCVLQDTYKHVA